MGTATALRTKESEQFTESEKVNKYGIESLGKSIPLLEGGASSASLMQQDDSSKLRRIIEVTKHLAPDKRDEVLNFLDQGLGESTSEPSVGVAEIVGVLKGLKDEMSKELSSDTAAEKAAALSFGELKGAKQQ